MPDPDVLGILCLGPARYSQCHELFYWVGPTDCLVGVTDSASATSGRYADCCATRLWDCCIKKHGCPACFGALCFFSADAAAWRIIWEIDQSPGVVWRSGRDFDGNLVSSTTRPALSFAPAQM